MIALRNIIRRLLWENGNPSLVRFLTAASFLVGCAVTAVDLWLTYRGHAWPNYATFAGLTFGGGFAQAISNKYINGRYNSPEGSPGPKGEG